MEKKWQERKTLLSYFIKIIVKRGVRYAEGRGLWSEASLGKSETLSEK
jgi:hypothetical protein